MTASASGAAYLPNRSMICQIGSPASSSARPATPRKWQALIQACHSLSCITHVEGDPVEIIGIGRGERDDDLLSPLRQSPEAIETAC